jgi:glucan phosphoethanolaminetransferase (alkaline phosphatase superfamily)
VSAESQPAARKLFNIHAESVEIRNDEGFFGSFAALEVRVMNRHQKPTFAACYLMLLGATCYALAFLMPWWIYGRYSVNYDMSAPTGHMVVRFVGWLLFSAGVTVYIYTKLSRRRRRRTEHRRPSTESLEVWQQPAHQA